jgi:SPP1 gp7 family putative phage head morphogenesis protein
LEPIRTPESWSRDLAEKVRELLQEFFIEPLLDATKPDTLANAKSKGLIGKIKDGSVWYDDPFFRGDRSIALSKQFRDMGAKFSKGQKAWRLERNRLPQNVFEAIEQRQKDALALRAKLQERLSQIQKKVMDIAPRLSFDVDAARQDRALQKEMQRTVPNAMAVQPQPDEMQKKHLQKKYSENVALSIKGFVDSEVLRFRDKVIPKITAGMDRRELRDYIEGRLGVSRDRAKFIARQETSLYISNLKESGYRSAGIEKYRWKAIGGRRGDGRTREEHMNAHGKEFFWDHSKNQNPVRNSKGQPVHPGIDFGCRCVAIPIVEEL